MKHTGCPNCNSQRIFNARVPSDVVVVVQCPACTELAVFFRDKAIALSRRILEKGTSDERRMHLADVIGQFLEPGMFDFSAKASKSQGMVYFKSKRTQPSEEEEESDVITDAEMERFTRFQLERLDDTDYFNRYFSN